MEEQDLALQHKGFPFESRFRAMRKHLSWSVWRLYRDPHPSLPPSRTTLLESFTAVCGFRKQMLAETPLLWGHIEDVTCMSCSVPCRSYSLKGESDECMWHLFALSDFWRPCGKYALNSHISETRVRCASDLVWLTFALLHAFVLSPKL